MLSKKQLVLHFPVKKYTRNSELSLLPLKSLMIFVKTWMALHNLEFLYSKPFFVFVSQNEPGLLHKGRYFQTEQFNVVFVCCRGMWGVC